MDSYRPGQPSDDDDNTDSRDGNETAHDSSRATDHDRNDSDRRNHGSPRDFSRARDHNRSDERTREYAYDRRRGPRHDLYNQNYAPGGGYRDVDREDQRGGRRFDPNQHMAYDDESDERGDRDRFGSRRAAPRGSLSDELRFRAQHEGPRNTGEQDKSKHNTPSRYLLIRDLKQSVDETLLAKGLEKLYRSADEHETGATPLSLRSVMIVKMRGTDENMGYGFAEFQTVEDAKAARAHSQILGSQCTVSSRPFFVDFPHSGVFPPASIVGKYGPTAKEFTFYNPSAGRDLKYYDERYYTRPQIVNEDPPTAKIDPVESSTKAAGNVQTGTKRGIDTLEIQQSKPKKAKKTLDQPAPLAELQKWQNKQAELREDVGTISEPQTSDEQTYAVDTEEHKRCYLCNTKFETSEKLVLHLQKSETHIAFLQTDAKKAKALDRLEKNGVSLVSTVKLPAQQTTVVADAGAASQQQQASQQWRDRAAERRKDDDTPQKVKMSLKGAGANKIPITDKSRPSSSGSDGPKPALNKGRGMLEKFGWSEGQGLGGDGGGRRAPVEQSMYTAGVGLGHEGSLRGDAVEEAGRRTKDEGGSGRGGGFLEATRENARKRYERM